MQVVLFLHKIFQLKLMWRGLDKLKPVFWALRKSRQFNRKSCRLYPCMLEIFIKLERLLHSSLYFLSVFLFSFLKFQNFILLLVLSFSSPLPLPSLPFLLISFHATSFPHFLYHWFNFFRSAYFLFVFLIPFSVWSFAYVLPFSLPVLLQFFSLPVLLQFFSLPLLYFSLAFSPSFSLANFSLWQILLFPSKTYRRQSVIIIITETSSSGELAVLLVHLRLYIVYHRSERNPKTF